MYMWGFMHLQISWFFWQTVPNVTVIPPARAPARNCAFRIVYSFHNVLIAWRIAADT
jgi:hypothetical protein